MKISFDLDDTLISKTKFPLEKDTFFHQFFSFERIRLGTIDLFKKLKSENHEIYIYTTSFRSVSKIRLMFFIYGISVDGIINQQKHIKVLGEKSKTISKLPSKFGIDIHVDDSKGVEMEGERHDFKTIIISDNDKNWTNFILKNIRMQAINI
ncbi:MULTISPECIES: hypothetical protein [Flavobacterium]|uniref:hypothetical protein n=1 Tax=Flavobacterium TaxID=237 RepID=UPI00188ACF33|nr:MULTISPECIES: hypothetical protein [Flavobacterium]MBF4473103.1 hypothetical protein [Flavobacterium sp. HJJ]